ncbi:hypothetical protein GCM10010470_53290 [Saccharopolyspora taberi]|uniref:Uncharacterized protein n=2 Tax=Saccharopolyspora taberi TaxID=60895 RepID=A0ABN3VKQ9_9PSEU
MVVFALTSWPQSQRVASFSAVQLRPATATVVRSDPCGAGTRGDLVEVRVGNQTRQARLDGCGHAPGQQLDVRIPVDPGADFVVRPGAPTGGGSSDDLVDRLSWVLVTIAGLAGGGYGMLLRPRRAA